MRTCNSALSVVYSFTLLTLAVAPAPSIPWDAEEMTADTSFLKPESKVYKVGRKIGGGGQSHVFIGLDKRTNLPVALKMATKQKVLNLQDPDLSPEKVFYQKSVTYQDKEGFMKMHASLNCLKEIVTKEVIYDSSDDEKKKYKQSPTGKKTSCDESMVKKQSGSGGDPAVVHQANATGGNASWKTFYDQAIVLDLLEKTLGAILEELHGKLTLPSVKKLGHQLLKAFRQVHTVEPKSSHTDVKTDNIMIGRYSLSQDDDAKIADFGMVKPSNFEYHPLGDLKQLGLVLLQCLGVQLDVSNSCEQGFYVDADVLTTIRDDYCGGLTVTDGSALNAKDLMTTYFNLLIKFEAEFDFKKLSTYYVELLKLFPEVKADYDWKWSTKVTLKQTFKDGKTADKVFKNVIIRTSDKSGAPFTKILINPVNGPTGLTMSAMKENTLQIQPNGIIELAGIQADWYEVNVSGISSDGLTIDFSGIKDNPTEYL